MTYFRFKTLLSQQVCDPDDVYDQMRPGTKPSLLCRIWDRTQVQLAVHSWDAWAEAEISLCRFRVQAFRGCACQPNDVTKVAHKLRPVSTPGNPIDLATSL